MQSGKCKRCENPVLQTDKFCQSCGAPMQQPVTPVETSSNSPKTFVSKGTYSGKMVKGKTSRGWKIFRNILIAIVVIGIIALIVWFQVDPEAGKKLTDVLMGIGFMIVFFFFGWLFMRGKKGKNTGWDD